jgi:hypothetical protein
MNELLTLRGAEGFVMMDGNASSINFFSKSYVIEFFCARPRRARH